MTESLSEETRQMLSSQTKAMMNMIDDICRPNHKPKPIRNDFLIKELRAMYNDYSLSDENHRSGVIAMAIVELGGTITNPD